MKAIYTQPLQSGYTYHILNQGNNGEDIFKEERNFDYFLKKYKESISPIADTYAWCLMPNHFHVQVQFKNYKALHEALPRRFSAPPENIKCSDEVATTAESEYGKIISRGFSRQFADFFNGYALAINKAYNRRGKLFSLPFKRIMVNDEHYFEWLICYIHRNAIHYGFCKNFEDWPFSSYHEIIRSFGNGSIAEFDLKNIVNTQFLHNWFDSKNAFEAVHQLSLDNLNQRYFLE